MIEILKDKTNISNYVEWSHFKDYKTNFKELKYKYDNAIFEMIELK